MDLHTLRRLISGTPLPDIAACVGELVAVRVARGLLDAREMEVVARLDDLAASEPTVFPDDVVSKAAKSSLHKASKVRSRKKACDDIPELGDAVADGSTTGERLDAVARATQGLSPSEKARLAGRGAELARAASSLSDSDFRRLLERLVRQAREDDGLDRLAKQRRATRLRWWTDPDGMWCLQGRFDPATGVAMEGRLRNESESQFHERTPDDCPTDPVDKQQFLAAHALVALSEGRGTSGLPDVTVLIDERTLREGTFHDDTVCDVGLGRFGLPIETIRRWACMGTVTPVIVGADGTRLLLGRETRLANREQRRALRALYRSCSLCDVPFDHCQIHHVTWYRLGGTTDIDNLLPVCSRHHHLVHEGGWQLHLAPDRTLTVVRPGGAMSRHGPPRVRNAA